MSHTSLIVALFCTDRESGAAVSAIIGVGEAVPVDASSPRKTASLNDFISSDVGC